jgi:hypothetical protein
MRSSIFKSGAKLLGTILFQFANMSKRNRNEENTFLLMLIETLTGKTPLNIDAWLSMLWDTAWELLSNGIEVEISFDIPKYNIRKGIFGFTCFFLRL